MAHGQIQKVSGSPSSPLLSFCGPHRQASPFSLPIPCVCHCSPACPLVTHLLPDWNASTSKGCRGWEMGLPRPQCAGGGAGGRGAQVSMTLRIHPSIPLLSRGLSLCPPLPLLTHRVSHRVLHCPAAPDFHFPKHLLCGHRGIWPAGRHRAWGSGQAHLEYPLLSALGAPSPAPQ